jgi:hypothetical protein
MKGLVRTQTVGVGKATRADNYREEKCHQGVGEGMALGLFGLNGMNSWTASVSRILPRNSASSIRLSDGGATLKCLKK